MLFCHELPRALHAFDFLYSEVEKDATVRSQVENSYNRNSKPKAGFFEKIYGCHGRPIGETACPDGTTNGSLTKFRAACKRCRRSAF